MYKFIVIMTFFMLGCGDIFVIQDCEKSTATLEEKLDCGKAESPSQCWNWIRNAKCTKVVYKYFRPGFGFNQPFRCDNTEKGSNAFEACVAKGWYPKPQTY
jgi:hypothetical protein